MFNNLSEDKKITAYASIAIIVCAVALNIFLLFFNPFEQNKVQPNTEVADTAAKTEEIAATEEAATTEAEQAEAEAIDYEEPVRELKDVEAADVELPDKLPDNVSAENLQEAVANAFNGDDSKGYSSVELLQTHIEDTTIFLQYGGVDQNGYSRFVVVTIVDDGSLSVEIGQ